MEGTTKPTNNLKFIEGRKVKIGNPKLTHGKLITAANNHGLLVIADGISLKFVPSDTTKFEQLLNVIPLDYEPSLVTVARHGYSSILFVSGINTTSRCPIIEVFNLDTRSSISRIELSPLVGTEIADYAWHPYYFDTMIALCSKSGHLLIASIYQGKLSIVYCSDKYGCLTCCWSPKGKNLAIGLRDGQVMRLEPIVVANQPFSFKEVDKSTINLSSPKMTPDHKLIRMRWINKTLIMSVHAKLKDGPDTIYSLFTVKPSNPFKYWTSLTYENGAEPNYNVHLVNLTNCVLAASNASGEAAVIGMDQSDWHSLLIDEEGARIELPLDANNRETYVRGATVAFIKNVSGDRPIVIFYTSDGTVIPYTALHNDNLLKLPEFQQPVDLPSLPELSNFVAAAPQVTAPQVTIPQVTVPQVTAPLSFSSLALELTPSRLPEPAPAPKDLRTTSSKVIQKASADDLKAFSAEVKSVKENMDFNEMFLSLLEGVNNIRDKFEEIQEVHQLHREALDSIKSDIDTLDLGMLENLYLVEYIKSRGSRKRSIDPLTTKKVETIKSKTKAIAEKLKTLDSHVDLCWEDFVRRSKNKGRRLHSLDVIYKTMATNQKIINVLKRKVVTSDLHNKSSETIEASPGIKPMIRELDQAKLKTFGSFLMARNVVPVRRAD